MRGPIDYIIVGFKEQNFTGEILEELIRASRDEIISVLDLALVTRSTTGDIESIEITDQGITEILPGLLQQPGLISDDDIDEVGELLEDGSAAGLLIIEQLWAKGLKTAIVDAGGTLLDEGRIHPNASSELSEEEV